MTRAEIEALADSTPPVAVEEPVPVIEPYEPFPVECLPDPLRTFVNVGSRSIGCDPAYIALPLLTATASVIGNSRRIQLKPGWNEPSVLWTANVGESGTMKTPAYGLAVGPLRELQRDELRAHEGRLADYERAKVEYDKRLRDWKASSDAGEPPAKPEEPAAGRFIVSDVTVEAIAPILKANPRGLLLARDELGGWISSFDRYVSGRGGDVANWLSMFNAETFVIDRKTGSVKTLMVENAAVCVTGGIQPGTLRRAVGVEHRENGLLARLLLAWPPPQGKRWTNAGIPPEQEARIGFLFDRLLELEPITVDDHPEPVIIRLTHRGQQTWIDFFNSHAQEQAGLTGDLASAWSKLECYAARLALVTHYVRWAAEDPTLQTPDAIDEHSMQTGVSLVRWFGREARRVYALLTESEEHRTRRELVELIASKGRSMSPRELMRCSRCYSTSALAQAALEDLEAAGLGRLEHVAPGPQGGHPAVRFVLAATVDRTPQAATCSEGSVNGEVQNHGRDMEGLGHG